VKFLWDTIKGEDIYKSERLKLSRNSVQGYAFRPNSFLQQGFLKGEGYIEFAEEKKGEFRRSENNVNLDLLRSKIHTRTSYSYLLVISYHSFTNPVLVLLYMYMF
jgi:hypothetical protein